MKTFRNSHAGALCATFASLCFLFQHCSSNTTGHYLTPPDTSTVSLPTSQGILYGYQGFKSLGYHKGETVPDLTLFSLNGQPFTLYKELKKHKPILLVSGSYTCDASRHNLPSLNKLTRKFKNKVDVYTVYIIDAHPRDTLSPYSINHQKWLSNANIKEHVEADQPRTYGQRKALATKWKQHYRILPPVLVDNPDNAFWINFGQAPNMVYLIEPDGTVAFKEEWYQPKDVETAVSTMLHTD